MVRNPDRELRQARAAYIGAARRASDALTAFDESGMPMNPPDDGGPPPWTPEQKRIIAALPRAFDNLIDAWRTWDGMLREHRHPPHG